MTTDVSSAPEEFEKEWTAVNVQVVNQLLANADIETIKQKVRTQGHIGLDDRDQFINLVNKIKYDVIYKRFGDADTDSYKAFVKAWQKWHTLKGTKLPKPENMFEDNIHHLMFGSTPDPDNFLKDFDVNES